MSEPSHWREVSGETGPGPAPIRRRLDSFGSKLLIVFLAALLVRVTCLWELRTADVSYILVGDGYGYHRWAREIAGGRWMGDTVFYQAPLYPYFLAVLYTVFPPSLLIVRMAQALLGAAACAWLGLAGRAFFSPRVGLLAAGLLAGYAPAVFFDGLIQKSVLDLALLTALLALLGQVWMRRGPDARPGRLLAAGLVLGLLALTRENALALAVVVPIWLLGGFREAAWSRRLLGAAAFLAGVLVALAPVVARNYAVGGELFLTTSQFGPNFFVGNNVRADGLYTPLRFGQGDATRERADATELAELALGRPLTPTEVSRYWTGQALAHIRSQPGVWLRLMVWKLYLTWNAQEIIDSEDPAVYADESRLLRVLWAFLHFGTIVPLAAIGVAATWGSRGRLWLLYLVLVAISTSVALFFVVARYRYPLVPVLILFGAAGFSAAWDGVRARRFGRVAVYGAIALGIGVGLNRPVVPEAISRAVMYRNLGVTLAREGEPERAIAYLRKALEVRPTYLDGRLALARVLAASGHRDDALREYREVLRREPRLVDADTELRRLVDRDP